MKETKSLPVFLTDTEIENYGRELAATLVAKGKLEAKRKEINAVIKPLVELSVELSDKIESGIEHRQVECKWEYSWGHGTRILYRTDTGEEVENGVIPEYERQAHFNL